MQPCIFLRTGNYLKILNHLKPWRREMSYAMENRRGEMPRGDLSEGGSGGNVRREYVQGGNVLHPPVYLRDPPCVSFYNYLLIQNVAPDYWNCGWGEPSPRSHESVVHTLSDGCWALLRWLSHSKPINPRVQQLQQLISDHPRTETDWKITAKEHQTHTNDRGIWTQV